MLHDHYAPCQHCHLRERSFDQKEYSSGSEAHILAWSESVWLLPFPETQIPPQRSWKTSRGHFHIKTSGTAAGSGNNFSGGVSLPKGTTLKWMMLIFSSVNKKCIAPVALLFRHTEYSLFVDILGRRLAVTDVAGQCVSHIQGVMQTLVDGTSR
jgi:hypothetical protein